MILVWEWEKAMQVVVVVFFLLTSQLYQSYKCDMAIYYIIMFFFL